MDELTWISWFVVGLLTIISITFLMGKGSFLISGYNISSKATKEKYDEKKLCRVMGVGFLIITLIMAIFTAYNYDLPRPIHWIMPYGIFATLIVLLVLTNTICKRK